MFTWPSLVHSTEKSFSVISPGPETGMLEPLSLVPKSGTVTLISSAFTAGIGTSTAVSRMTSAMSSPMILFIFVSSPIVKVCLKNIQIYLI